MTPAVNAPAAAPAWPSWAAGALAYAATLAAAADDVTAWCLLAFVVGVARASVGGALLTLALAAAFVVVMLMPSRSRAKGSARPVAGCSSAAKRGCSCPRVTEEKQIL